MKFYTGTDIKNQIIKELKTSLENFSEQKESDEYINIAGCLNLVENYDFEAVENILSSDSTAFCWLNSSDGRVYINVKNKKGYRYPIKNNFLGKM